MSTTSNSWLASRFVAVLFLLWTLAGLAAFVMQGRQDLGALARTDPYQARTFAEMPAWAWGAYGVAVAAGFLGALLLVLRRKGAVLLSVIEIAAVLIQFGYTFFGTDLLQHKGLTETLPFPAAIIIIAIIQFLYARWMARRGLLG